MMMSLLSVQTRPAALLCCLACATLLSLGCSEDDPGPSSEIAKISDVGGNNQTSDSGADDTDLDASGTDADAAAPGDGGDVNAGDTNDASDSDASDDDASDGDDGGGDAGDDVDPPGPSADTCATAIDVSAGGTWSNQSTVGANDDYDAELSAPGCPNGSVSGNDRVYVATPGAFTEYRVTVEPLDSFDPFIYVRASCTDQACMAGTVLNGPGESESVEFELQASETGHIIVDGELGDSGDYTLTVEIL